MNSLFKDSLRFAPVHQDRLGAEHLRDFRQDSCSSLCYQKVGKDT